MEAAEAVAEDIEAPVDAEAFKESAVSEGKLFYLFLLIKFVYTVVRFYMGLDITDYFLF